MFSQPYTVHKTERLTKMKYERKHRDGIYKVEKKNLSSDAQVASFSVEPIN